MAKLRPEDRAANRYVAARLNRFEEALITEMARREGVTTSAMIRECILREAVRPMFGQLPISEVVVDAD